MRNLYNDRRMVKCPNCGLTVLVDIEDVIDIEEVGINQMVRDVVGQCPACKAGMEWEEEFQFTSIKSVELSNYEFCDWEEEDD